MLEAALDPATVAQRSPVDSSTCSAPCCAATGYLPPGTSTAAARHRH